MKFPFGFVLVSLLVWGPPAAAQATGPAGAAASAGAPGTRIYRCGNTYTNDIADAQARGCTRIDTGNITVVPGTRVYEPPSSRAATASRAPQQTAPAAATAVPPAAPGGSRTDSAAQRARDADARFILEAELKKAEARHAELLREYNNGEPERLGSETRNHQKYLDRVAELKAAVARSEADVAGIRRELSRLSASK